jgi:hypothetical protein
MHDFDLWNLYNEFCTAKLNPTANINATTVRNFGIWLRNEKYWYQVDYGRLIDPKFANQMSAYFSRSRPVDDFVNGMIQRLLRVVKLWNTPKNEVLSPYKIELNDSGPIDTDTIPLKEAVDQAQIESTEPSHELDTQNRTPDDSCQSETNESLSDRYAHFNAHLDELCRNSNQSIPPVVFGHRDMGSTLDITTLESIDTVSIYDAPSEYAIRSGCAGLGRTGLLDFQMAIEREGFSPYDERSVIVEAIKLACYETYDVTYSMSQIYAWLNLLIEQLSLFPNLKLLRVLCSKPIAKLLFNMMRWTNLLKGVTQQVMFRGGQINLRWYSHSSPTNIRFNYQKIISERKKLEDSTRGYRDSLSVEDFDTFKNTGIEELRTKHIHVPFNRRVHIQKPKQRKPQMSQSSEINVDDQLKSKLLSLSGSFSLPKEERESVLQNPVEAYVESQNPVQAYIERFNLSMPQRGFSINNEQSQSTSHDGYNCQFDSVAVQLPDADDLRSRTVEYLHNNRAEYEDFVTGSIDNYLAGIEREDWGDEVTLRAMSNMLQREIVVVQEGVEVAHTYTPDNPQGIRLYLAYFSDIQHYEPVQVDPASANNMRLANLNAVPNIEVQIPLEESSEPLLEQEELEVGETIYISRNQNLHSVQNQIENAQDVTLEAIGSAIQEAVRISMLLTDFVTCKISTSLFGRKPKITIKLTRRS